MIEQKTNNITAKNGDVIISSCGIFIFDKVINTFYRVYCGLYNSGKLRYYDALLPVDSFIRLATSMEEELLIKSFKQSHYKWYKKKKKLRRIDQFNIDDVIKNKITGKVLRVGGFEYDSFGTIKSYILCDINQNHVNRHILFEAKKNWSVIDF